MYKVLVVDDEPLIKEYMKKNIPLLNKNWEVAADAMDGVETGLQAPQSSTVPQDIRCFRKGGIHQCKTLLLYFQAALRRNAGRIPG